MAEYLFKHGFNWILDSFIEFLIPEFINYHETIKNLYMCSELKCMSEIYALITMKKSKLFFTVNEMHPYEVMCMYEEMYFIHD